MTHPTQSDRDDASTPPDRETVARAAKVPRLRFGDIIENGWASERNPTRTGFFVREGHRKGQMNPGRWIEVTDGKGSFWELSTRGEHRITVTPGFLAHPALRGRGEGGAGEGQGVTTETERGDGSLPVPSPQQYHAGDASRRAAFRAGWYVNAVEPPDQTEEYLAACEAADYRDYCASQDAKQ